MITLNRLVQSRTYYGLLEGTPNRHLNDRLIEEAIERATRLMGLDAQPYLIAPNRKKVTIESGVAPVRVEEWLPQIECIADFHSHRPVRDKTKDASSLTVVWYQSEFGIDPKTFEELATLDWERHAVDWAY